MLSEPEVCPICSSRIPAHCRDKAEGSEHGRLTKIHRIYCPACDSGWEHTYADLGLGAFGLTGASRLREDSHELGHLRLKHEEMTDRVLVAAE